MFKYKKLGKLPFVYDPTTPLYHNYSAVLDTLPQPEEVHWKSPTPLKMLLNDQLGDCVPAGRLHYKMTQLFSHGIKWIPTDAQALTDYRKVGGYVPGNPSTDNGCVMLTMAQYLYAKGAIEAYMQINMKNIAHVKQAINTFGGILAGWALPACLDENSTDWIPPASLSGSGTPGSLGGHCTYLPGYDAQGVDNITWGERIRARWDFFTDYTDEGWIFVTKDWIAKNNESPSGFNIQQLLADQKMVA